jgi:hypothetical protein
LQQLRVPHKRRERPYIVPGAGNRQITDPCEPYKIEYRVRIASGAAQGDGMREYRIITIGDNGEIAAVKIFECANDEHAIQKAQEMAQALNVIELRQEGRLIKRFGP